MAGANYTLPPDVQDRVDRLVAQLGFDSPDDVVRAAMQALEDSTARRQPSQPATGRPSPEAEGIDLSQQGIDESQAADLRRRLAPFAEDWNRPELDVYDAL